MAMDWEFHLPLTHSDLLRNSGPGRYVVQEVMSIRELQPALTAFRTAFRARGALAVLQHFDTLYSLLHQFKAVGTAVKEDALELMMCVVSHHSNELPAILGDSGLSHADRAAHLNALKMNCYLLTGLVDAFEMEVCKSDLVENKKNRTKTSGSLWEEDREPLLQLLTQLLQLDLRQLWGGLVVEEEFISLMTGSCYRVLENSSIGLQRYRATREAVTHLLAAALLRYDHMFSATLKITQMLQHFEHVAPVFAQAVSLWATEYGLKSLVGELLREISQKCPQDVTRDASGMKGYATFITELSEQIPALVLSNMSVLLRHLDGESYMMRNAVLTAMAEVLLQVLNGDQLEEAARGTRDQFLNMLQAHVCDINSFVRSRVLQLFTRIVQRKVLPLAHFQSVVSLAVGRLKDKSVVVVKNAIQLLSAFLSNNPFSCKLNCTDLAEPLKKEVQKLQEMRDRSRSTAAPVITPEEEWEAMLPEVKAAIQQLFQPPQEGEEEVLEVKETVESTLEQISGLLRKLDYKSAARLTQKALCRFQGKEPFSGTTEENEEAAILSVLERLYTGPCPDENSEDPPAINGSLKTDEVVPEEQLQTGLVKQEMLVQYLQDAYNFSLKITEALSLISKLMYENCVSVVQEAIDFFVTVSKFGVPQALLGVRRMLPLIWSKEPGIKEAVLNAYRQLYLSPSRDSERAKAQGLVHSLSLIMVDASLGTIQCLEEILSEFVQKDEIKPAVIQLLWEQFTEKSSCSPLERRTAVMLLGMMARGKPEIIGSNLDILVTAGLSEKVCEDYRLAQEVCSAISKLASSPKPALGKSNPPFRLPQNHMLFSCLSETVSKGFAQPSGHWIPFMEAAVKLIYQLAEGAEEICAHILQACSQQALEKLQESDEQKADPGASPSRVSDGACSLPTFLLMHLVSLVGQVALQEVVYLEVSVSAELRRRRILGDEQKAKKHSDNSTKKQRPRSTGNETTMEEELDLVGASADDTEAELIRSICETELLDGNHLFSAFVPLVLKICNNPGIYSDSALSAAAALALGKVCMISSEFCDSHLRLLFTMMEKSALPSVRSNLIIAAGDLAIRFPNLVDPWTSHLYARLRDPCPSVRQTAGLVMTHLILKDMVKVKGQVSEMATLLIDPEEAIMGVAQNFFSELSNKGNAIYNLLPDIISHLSDPNRGIEEESFHNIMRHLFSYITKDKQTESLVEKLCQRFRTARTERQYRDLSRCLTLLPLSERGLHKLQDNFDCFADKLQDTAVYSCFQTVLLRFRRAGGKPETKALAEELEQKLSACHNRGQDSAETCQEVHGTPMPEPAKRKPTGSSHRQPLSTANSDEDFVTPHSRSLRHYKSNRSKRSQKRPPTKKAIVTFSSDENSSEDDMLAELKEEETPTKTTPITRSSARRLR
ncbi:condensin complex subunit 1 [Colius striatus]|uniref:condensin complex subunit 1 n=1 Tax=Colius striatus TaxID=57412 RepID=UPI002B1E2868|nr:condensin complex subunit 1 [Colius striatus]XP_061861794.1 condensin complex subunit 1 [Colius striatus]XP_061861799.1 condensin complex subunit 1 [Colius striatus]XP_061861805.1 condensin complex subunit 1 [Colius striatus]